MTRLTRLERVLIVLILTMGGLIFAIAARRTGKGSMQEPSVREKIHAAVSMEPEALQERILAHPELAWRFRAASWGGFLLMFGVLFGWLRVFSRWFTHRPAVTPIGVPPPPVWQGRQMFRLVLGLVLIGQAVLVAEWALARWFQPPWMDRHVVAVANTFIVDAAVLLVGGSWIRRSRARAGDAGPGFFPAVRFAAVSYLTVLPLLIGVLMLVAKVADTFHLQPEPQPVFSIFLLEPRRAVVLGLLFLAALAGPVAEEIFFRGLLYGWLRGRVGIRWALVLSAFLFACLHTDLFSFAPIFVLGLLFGWVYEETGSLAAPAAIHAIHNTGMLYVAFLLRTLASLS